MERTACVPRFLKYLSSVIKVPTITSRVGVDNSKIAEVFAPVILQTLPVSEYLSVEFDMGEVEYRTSKIRNNQKS
jgi:hypothetical protein